MAGQCVGIGHSDSRATIVGAIESWCEALHGNVSLARAVRDLAVGLGADAALLVRTHSSDGRPSRIAAYDRLTAAETARPLNQSYADMAFGPEMRRPRPASVWLTSLIGGPPCAVLSEFQAHRRFGDFGTMILAASGSVRDHLELHFRAETSRELQLMLSEVVPTMARTWANRQVGLVTRTVINHRMAQHMRPSRPTQGPVLGYANPYRLSRAEFRVCVLLSRGHSVQSVCTELSLADATVRTHLRNIYAKTETGGLAGLVFLLLSPDQGRRFGDEMCA